MQFSKLAVIADIHSNIFALDAVLEDIAQHNVDMIVNLGDIFYGPIAPGAVYTRLLSLTKDYANITTIKGNQDREIIHAREDEINANATLKFVLNDLSASAIDWLKQLPFDAQLTNAIYLCHASPTDDSVYLLETVDNGYPQVRNDAEIVRLLAGNTSELILCGHSHLPNTIALASGQMIVNCGSVGLPAYADDYPVAHKMQTYSPYASYAIIDSHEDESGKICWRVTHHKIAYDFESAADLALSNGREDWHFALRTGRVQAW